jgi:hypothetical protein
MFNSCQLNGLRPAKASLILFRELQAVVTGVVPVGGVASTERWQPPARAVPGCETSPVGHLPENVRASRLCERFDVGTALLMFKLAMTGPAPHGQLQQDTRGKLTARLRVSIASDVPIAEYSRGSPGKVLIFLR